MRCEQCGAYAELDTTTGLQLCADCVYEIGNTL